MSERRHEWTDEGSQIDFSIIGGVRVQSRHLAVMPYPEPEVMGPALERYAAHLASELDKAQALIAALTAERDSAEANLKRALEEIDKLEAELATWKSTAHEIVSPRERRDDL